MIPLASLLDLFVKIGAKDEASSKIGAIAEKAKSAFSTIGQAAATGLKAVGVATAAATAAATALTKSAVTAYGDYEQLVGGVETLFGAGGQTLEEYAKSVGQTTEEANAKYSALMQAQQAMMDNANKAYLTAGLSANDYMETVTGFSASLIQSLGGDTVKAAQYADMALTDMSDNANKMGTDMESIQNAYQGFAKQNYTMLDNLKLGYGGTKSEMERLLADAEAISGVEYNIDSYADVVSAIHEIQTEMGITGTTAHEAATTIQGSVNTMKAAWTNWLTGLGDSNADMEALTGNLLSSVLTAADNILPVVQNVLNSVATVLTTQGPTLIGTAINFITDNLPGLLDAGIALIGSLVDGISEALPDVITTLVNFITDNLPKILDSGAELLGALVEGIMDNLPQIADAALDLITELIDGLIESLPDIVKTGIELIYNLANSITKPGTLAYIVDAALDVILGFVDGLAESFPTMVETGVEILWNLCVGILESIPKIVVAAIEVIGKFVLAIGEEMERLQNGLGGNVVEAIIDGISAAWGRLTEWFTNLWDGLFGGTKEVNVQVNKTTTERTVYASNTTSEKPGLPATKAHAIGLSYVPYNGYIAELHRGEAVLTAPEAKSYRNGEKKAGATFNGGINIYYTNSGEPDEENVKKLAEMLQFEIERREIAFG